MEKIKLLILSDTPWDDCNSFGSSFSNIFGGDRYEIANVYCRPGLPNTDVASRFFRISEKSIIKNILHGTPSGCVITDNHPAQGNHDGAVRRQASILRWQILFWGRDMIWATGRWCSKELDEFVQDFDPDLIVLPVYYSTYLNSIGCYLQRLTGKPMIGYISDDCYTLRQFSLSPLYWIDRLIKRRYVKKAILALDKLYVITETQRREYNAIFSHKCKVLYKGGDFSEYTPKQVDINNINLTYTGNLGCGRWKVLAEIGQALDPQSQNLHIYSGTGLSKSQLRKLTAFPAVHFHGSVPAREIPAIQSQADILIHVESFQLAHRYKARLSFSTKIVDYLASSRCILAAGWEETGGIEYLSDHDAAVTITDEKEIKNTVKELVNNPARINEYARKAFECGRRNHQLDHIRDGLQKDIEKTCTNESISSR